MVETNDLSRFGFWELPVSFSTNISICYIALLYWSWVQDESSSAVQKSKVIHNFHENGEKLLAEPIWKFCDEALSADSLILI